MSLDKIVEELEKYETILNPNRVSMVGHFMFDDSIELYIIFFGIY